MTTRLTRTWPMIRDSLRRRLLYKSLEEEFRDMPNPKMNVDDNILKEMEEKLKREKEALDESEYALRAESKIVVETEEDAAHICDLVKEKWWKVKLLVHDSAHHYVKQGIANKANEVGLTVKVVKDSVMKKH